MPLYVITLDVCQSLEYWRFKNDVPQESVPAPLLFNIYISDLPTIVSRKYAYADDLAIMHVGGDW